jgi:hypothetical protein
LKDFIYKLAIALINSLADAYFQNVLIANPTEQQQKQRMILPWTNNSALSKIQQPRRSAFQGRSGLRNIVIQTGRT